MLGIKMWRVAIVSLIVALLEVAGVVIGFAVADISVLLLPYLTALAGGAMLYVISDEMIPETHAHGYEKYATFALVVGVVMMLFVQKFV
jgi:ZIP family zinc transporter